MQYAVVALNFNPLRPWGRRHNLFTKLRNLFKFQPAPPVGAETSESGNSRQADVFQPAPPVGAETRKTDAGRIALGISTRSARGGGDIKHAQDHPGIFVNTG